MNTITKPTRGERNNNPGNIRRSAICWRGEVVGADRDFECFDTPENGIRALAKLLAHYIGEGFDTVEKIISRYAPANENNTRAYINAVMRDTGIVGENDLLTKADIPALVHAIIWHENGRVIYSDDQIHEGISRA